MTKRPVSAMVYDPRSELRFLVVEFVIATSSYSEDFARMADKRSL